MKWCLDFDEVMPCQFQRLNIDALALSFVINFCRAPTCSLNLILVLAYLFKDTNQAIGDIVCNSSPLLTHCAFQVVECG